MRQAVSVLLLALLDCGPGFAGEQELPCRVESGWGANAAENPLAWIGAWLHENRCHPGVDYRPLACLKVRGARKSRWCSRSNAVPLSHSPAGNSTRTEAEGITTCTGPASSSSSAAGSGSGSSAFVRTTTSRARGVSLTTSTSRGTFGSRGR